MVLSFLILIFVAVVISLGVFLVSINGPVLGGPVCESLTEPGACNSAKCNLCTWYAGGCDTRRGSRSCPKFKKDLSGMAIIGPALYLLTMLVWFCVSRIFLKELSEVAYEQNIELEEQRSSDESSSSDSVSSSL
jgi:hypothetical protein